MLLRTIAADHFDVSADTAQSICCQFSCMDRRTLRCIGACLYDGIFDSVSHETGHKDCAPAFCGFGHRFQLRFGLLLPLLGFLQL